MPLCLVMLDCPLIVSNALKSSLLTLSAKGKYARYDVLPIATPIVGIVSERTACVWPLFVTLCPTYYWNRLPLVEHTLRCDCH